MSEVTTITTKPDQRCSEKECTTLIIDGRQQENYILHLIVEVQNRDGSIRTKKLAFHCAVCLYKWLWKKPDDATKTQFCKQITKLGWGNTE